VPLIEAGGTSERVAAGLRRRCRPVAARAGRRGSGPRVPEVPSAELSAAGLWPPAEQVLRLRRSTREFATQPVSFAQLRLITRSAFAAQARDWPQQVHGDLRLAMLIAAFRVTGLPNMMYVADSAQRSQLTPLPDLPRLPDLRGVYADAPALLYVCGDLARACELSGASGYGALLVRAGALGHAAWLSAISVGLAGSVYGRASGSVTRAARCFDDRLRHLFTLAVGHGADQVEAD
jgi:hypothetical protein